MSIRKENNEIDMGDPTNISAKKGSGPTPPKDGTGASFKTGISGLPEQDGSNSYPKQGRIAFGKDKAAFIDKI